MFKLWDRLPKSSKVCVGTDSVLSNSLVWRILKNLWKDYNLEHVVSKILILTVVLGDFSTRQKGLYKNNVASVKDLMIDIVTFHFGKGKWNILDFALKPNLVMHSDAGPSLHTILSMKLFFQNLFLKYIILPHTISLVLQAWPCWLKRHRFA